jgi:hypothetical protein
VRFDVGLIERKANFKTKKEKKETELNETMRKKIITQ